MTGSISIPEILNQGSVCHYNDLVSFAFKINSGVRQRILTCLSHVVVRHLFCANFDWSFWLLVVVNTINLLSEYSEIILFPLIGPF